MQRVAILECPIGNCSGLVEILFSSVSILWVVAMRVQTRL